MNCFWWCPLTRLGKSLCERESCNLNAMVNNLHLSSPSACVTIIPGKALTPDLISHWRQLQDANPDLTSPFFAPEFTLAVAHARKDVYVAILRHDTELAGFFPFQKSWLGSGKPVGGILSDYHGLITSLGALWDPHGLLRLCGLRSWEFN